MTTINEAVIDITESSKSKLTFVAAMRLDGALNSTPITVSEAADLLSPAYTIGHATQTDLRRAWMENDGLAEA